MAISQLMYSVHNFYMVKHGKLPTRQEAYEYFGEELDELGDALLTTDKSAKAKEAADVLFTLAGLCMIEGIDLDRAFELIVESNMTKEHTPEGKVVKGPDYVPPLMHRAFKKYA